jgi:hypothetical protein
MMEWKTTQFCAAAAAGPSLCCSPRLQPALHSTLRLTLHSTLHSTLHLTLDSTLCLPGPSLSTALRCVIPSTMPLLLLQVHWQATVT